MEPPAGYLTRVLDRAASSIRGIHKGVVWEPCLVLTIDADQR